MTDPWPPVPVRISGGVVLRLARWELVTITLDLAIVATHRIARWVGAVDQARATSPVDPLARPASPDEWTLAASTPDREAQLLAGLSLLQASNGDGAPEDGELREILDLLDKTSHMLD
jgi:hypothetical protein